MVTCARGLPRSIIKKYGITKKAWRVFRGRKKGGRSKSAAKKTKRRVSRTAKKKRRRRRGIAIGLASVGVGLAPVLVTQNGLGVPWAIAAKGNYSKAFASALINMRNQGLGIAAGLIAIALAKQFVGNPTILNVGRFRLKAL